MTERVTRALGALERAHAALEVLSARRMGEESVEEARRAVQEAKEAVAGLIILAERLRRGRAAVWEFARQTLPGGLGAAGAGLRVR